MTASNRFLNRLVLVIVGIIALAAAALAGWPVVTGRPLPVALPDDSDALALTVVIAAAVLVVGFAIAWILTRGRGRRRHALEGPDVQIDTDVVASLVRQGLSSSPDVAATKVRAYQVRRQRTLLLTVQTRAHPDLVALTVATRRAIASADERLGVALPLVVHFTTGVRTTLAGQRVTH